MVVYFPAYLSIRIIPITAKIIEKMKIHLHPRDVAIAPPANEAKPEPPQEPIDQKLRAR